jgi:uncharacterized protein (TIGR02246 family)
MTTVFVLALASLVTGFASAASPDRRAPDSERAAIEALHQRDIQATLSGDVDQLVSLFTDDGVLLSQDAPPFVGKEAIRAHMKEQKAQSDAAGMKVLKYAPAIRDLVIQDGFAYEWGQFEAVQQTRDGRRIEFHGKLLRILNRQADGSWRFSRIMWNADRP